MFRASESGIGSFHDGRKNSVISPFYTRSVIGSTRSKVPKKSRVRDATKITIIMAIPIGAILVVTTMGLIDGTIDLTASKIAKERLENVMLLSDLVGRLQVERGLSAMYLSSKRTNEQALENLKAARERTDKAIAAINWWPPLTVNDDEVELNDTQQLSEHITEYRERVNSVTEVLTPVINIGFYTSINIGILDQLAQAVTLKGADRLLVALDSVLRAGDSNGILRAIGSSYYAPCRFPNGLEKMFNILNAQAALQKEQSFLYRPGSKTYYQKLLDNLHPLEETIQKSTAHMLERTYIAECLNISLDVRFVHSIHWFDNMTSYMSTFTALRNVIISDLEVKVDADNKAAKKMFVTSLLLMTLVSSVGLITLRILIFMTKKVELQARISSLKTNQLENEHKRTDTLLNQLMPKVIIQQLKENKPVQAEFYDSVSIYFSDIVGFTNISSMLRPHEVVQMLNEIYGTFDAILDKRDVYKVETIGDAYLVASGIPIRNGNRHASEIALVAVQIAQMMKSYAYDSENAGDVPVRLRIGLHSGSCAAGVVGVKMPRYCIFGEALIIAQCMESSGMPEKIQVSSFTRYLLEGNKKFNLTKRHSTTVQGKTMETFWLEAANDTDAPKALTLNLPESGANGP